ncbi:hypothetical protein BT69DRAFT_1343687 [Atractiella rhizophila]|nr:hypothetical protein BT69DRAFT_1343687 [Atractiella rhizophila]
MSQRPNVVYREDNNLKVMLDLIQAEAGPPRVVQQPAPPVGAEILFGRSLESTGVSQETRQMLQGVSNTLDELNARMDAILLRALRLPS